MAANTHPNYKCPFCRAKFVRPFGFRTGREFHVRTKHPEKFAEFCAAKKEGRYGFGDFNG